MKKIINEGRFDNLSVSMDGGQVVLLFTPDMNDLMKHHHIMLPMSAGLELFMFLKEAYGIKFLGENNVKL